MAKENPRERAARLAQARAEQRSAERRRNLLMIGGVVLAMVVIVAGGFVLSRITSDTPKDSAAAAAAGSVTIGPDDAPHRVVIYEDFLCPFCGELEHATSTKLADLAAAGKVQVEYRPFDLLQTAYSANSLEVFQTLAHTSTAEITKKFHDLAFADQPSEAGPYPSSDDLVRLAVQAGASEALVRDGLDGKAGSWADEATKAASDAGVRSTPTVLLDGKEFVSGNTVEDRAAGLFAALE